MNSIDNYLVSDADLAEAGHFYTILDTSHLIDDMGVVPHRS